MRAELKTSDIVGRRHLNGHDRVRKPIFCERSAPGWRATHDRDVVCPATRRASPGWHRRQRARGRAEELVNAEVVGDAVYAGEPK